MSVDSRERFLHYAVEKGRKIRMVLTLDGKLAQKTVTVLSVQEDRVTLCIGAHKTPVTVALSDIFACDYARGDHGED